MPDSARKFFHSYGEMASLAQGFDWSASSLGPPHQWSHALLTTANIVLSSPHPMFLFWGPDHIQFYNDAYRPSLNGKHPGAFGQPAHLFWPEIWHQIGPQLRSVIEKGEAISSANQPFHLTRYGKLEETFWTYSFSPVHDENGVIRGVFVVCTETTAFVKAERQRDTSNQALAVEHRRLLAREKFLLDLTDRLRQLSDPLTLMQAAAESLGRHLNVGRVGYGEASDDGQSVVFQTGWAQGSLTTLSGSVPVVSYGHETDQDFRRGVTVVYPDVRSELHLSNLDLYESISARAVIAVPYLRGGIWRGTLYVNHPEPRDWTAEEVALVQEVAERTAEAAERAHIQAELTRSDARLRVAVDTAHLGVWQLDLPARNLQCSDLCKKNYGRQASDRFHFQDLLAAIHPDDRPGMEQAIQSALDSKSELRCEYRVIWPDLSVHWIIASGRFLSPAASSAGEGVQTLVGISVDVTERKISEAALVRSEKLVALGRLASSIAHEINNPLEAVTNLLFLAELSEDQAEIREYLASAQTHLQRASAITNQTLRFHRQATNPIHVTCEDLFSSVLAITASRIRHGQVQLEERMRAKRGVLCFDGEIRQVLSNLVGNAIDAMQPEGGRLLIRSREGNHLSTGRAGIFFTVADSGPGMSREIEARIFDAFYTTKGTSGTGLGLSISKDIVDRHHGVIRVRSSQTPGCHGTVFSLFLPFEAPTRLKPAS